MTVLPLLRGNRRAIYVGAATHGATEDGVPFPVGVRPGDLACCSFLSSRSIVGTGWTYRLRSQLGVAFKLLTAGDIASPPDFSADTNVIMQVVRGPRSLSAERDGATFTGSSVGLSGFAKSPGCMGYYAVTSSEDDDVSIAITPNIFTANSSSVGPTAFALTSRVGVVPGLYADNSDFAVNASIFGGNKNAAVFEFIF